jgi:hypothetical protein
MDEFNNKTRQLYKIVWHLDKNHPRYMLAGSPSWRECIENHAQNLGREHDTVIQACKLLDYIDTYRREHFENLR